VSHTPRVEKRQGAGRSGFLASFRVQTRAPASECDSRTCPVPTCVLPQAAPILTQDAPVLR
jgi:hypothetical protein